MSQTQTQSASRGWRGLKINVLRRFGGVLLRSGARLIRKGLDKDDLSVHVTIKDEGDCLLREITLEPVDLVPRYLAGRPKDTHQNSDEPFK